MRSGLKKIWLVLFVMAAGVMFVSWLGADNYDDCVVEGMRGQAVERVYAHVRAACREKFQVKKPLRQALNEIIEEDAPQGSGDSKKKVTVSPEFDFSGIYDEDDKGRGQETQPRMKPWEKDWSEWEKH